MKKTIMLGVALVAALGLTSCAKMAEPWHDASRGDTNDAPADIFTMPDGFSNGATKCDHGNRVYVLFHGDSTYGALAVVPDAKDCA